MKINKLTLENIRSYKYQEIVFDKGITLFSGDIGSGKTTTLLAIEFALFGLIKGKISSDSLLRQGTKSCSVVLDFNIQNKNIIIKRRLTKSGSTIKQESGFLTIDGVEQQFTPQELRARIIELLGYSSEFINKSPAIIYRYTVYTAQEDMKMILFESADARMETIRKIFNIDKYKIIKNNISIYVKELNARIRETKAKTEDIPELNSKIKEIEEQMISLKKDIQICSDHISSKFKEVQELNSKLSELEDKILEQNTLRQKLVISKTKISSFNSQKESVNKQIEDGNSKIKDKPPLDIPDVESLKKELIELNESKKEIEDKKQDYLNKKAILTSRLKEATSVIQEVAVLDNCPTCRQEVKLEHKTFIKKQENEKIEVIEDKLNKLNTVLPRFDEKTDFIDTKTKKLQEQISQINLMKLKIDTYEDKLKLKQTLDENIKSLESNLEIEKQRLEKFTKDIDTNLIEINDKTKAMFKETQEELKQLEVRNASQKKELEMKQESIELINKQIQDKNILLKNIQKQIMLRCWLDSFFLTLMQTMERYVLNSILREFNEYFKEWFDMLIEDENISVRLDDSFTPIVEQNGYENYVQNLSGGEKTSVALAYRLALNKVINDFVSTIKTKGLLILDEPTDGFSSNQLDKLRDVLIQIKSEQIILVSHENKLESYADNIIRLIKEHHVSSVV